MLKLIFDLGNKGRVLDKPRQTKKVRSNRPRSYVSNRPRKVRFQQTKKVRSNFQQTKKVCFKRKKTIQNYEWKACVAKYCESINFVPF